MTNLLLVTSNGTGMGHLMRQVSIARATDDNATIFSLSLGLPLATGLGVDGEYCPSYDLPWIASNRWHGYLRDRLVTLSRELDVAAVLFDGVAPYPGIGLAARAMRDVAFIWLRRGMWRSDVGAQHLRKTHFFDFVIEPGDLGASADVGLTAGLSDARRVAPISILETFAMQDRNSARRALGLPQDGPIALVTLGSGRLGDVRGPGEVAVNTILETMPEWHIAVTKSPVALNEIPLARAERITVLAGAYPLAAYLNAFDAAVSSAGYNAVHELIPAGVPTLLVANTSTRTDDQSARARGIEAAGLGLAIDDTDLDDLPTRVRHLSGDDIRSAIATAGGATLATMTGAAETANATAEFATGYTPSRRSTVEVFTSGWREFKDRLKVVIGEDATNRVRRALGRTAPTSVHAGVKVRLDSDPAGDGAVPLLRVIGPLAPSDLDGTGPVEHVLPGTSEDYASKRRDLIAEYYDLVT